MSRSQYQRLNPCSMCKVEAECADNNWCLYDPYNKKCPNWLEGVKSWHKFLKDDKRERRFLYGK